MDEGTEAVEEHGVDLKRWGTGRPVGVEGLPNSGAGPVRHLTLEEARKAFPDKEISGEYGVKKEVTVTQKWTWNRKRDSRLSNSW